MLLLQIMSCRSAARCGTTVGMFFLFLVIVIPILATFYIRTNATVSKLLLENSAESTLNQLNSQ